MRKRIIVVLCGLLCLAALSGCGNSKPEESKKTYVDPAEIDNVYASPDDYKGQYIELTGKVFTEPEVGSDSISFQIFADIENSEKNTVVITNDTTLDVKDGDYVKVNAKIDGAFKGTNSFGGLVEALQVSEASVEISSYVDLVAPAIKTIEPTNATIDQYGCVVSITKIEIAENETRVYVTATNNSEEDMSIYSFNAKLLQNNKQIEEAYNYDADYEEVQSDILPGMESSGIMLFDAVDPSVNFQVYIEARNDNFRLDFEPYTFDITVE